MHVQAIVEWLKQPSTIKAIMVLAGLVGFKYDPARAQEIIEAGLLLYVGIQAFYNQQPRKPVDPLDPVALESKLTTEQISAIVKLRRAKLNAEKPA